jgi:hypothetical protein
MRTDVIHASTRRVNDTCTYKALTQLLVERPRVRGKSPRVRIGRFLQPPPWEPGTP